MPSPYSYLIPASPLGSNECIAQPALDSLVQGLVKVYQMALNSATLVLKTAASPQLSTLEHHSNLGIAHAKAFTSPCDIGVTSCLLQNLSMVCDCVLKLCSDSLLAKALVLDEAHQQAKLPVDAWEDFCNSLKLLARACCAEYAVSGNLMREVQTLIPPLARLSAQIDNEMMTLQAQLTQLPTTAIPAQMVHLASIEAFNQQVHELLTTAQSIVNVMSDWQDSLSMLMAVHPSTQPAHFYAQQIQAGIDYWLLMQTTLNHYLALYIERKI